MTWNRSQTLTKAEHDALPLTRPATDDPIRPRRHEALRPDPSGVPSLLDQYTGHLRSPDE